ncbi:MAG TPA: hypothetical protein VI542_25355 [Candidatus Tectomicrobia bacterium]
MLPMLYILDGRLPVPAPDRRAWGHWLVSASRRVTQATLAHAAVVTTVFLGLAHGTAHDGTPLLWETVVTRDGRPHPTRVHTATWDEAEAAHARIVQVLRRAYGG